MSQNQAAQQPRNSRGNGGQQLATARVPQAHAQRDEPTSEDLMEFGYHMRLTDDSESKWTQKVREGDIALQLQRSQQSPSRAPTMIRQTYTPTTGSPTRSNRGQPVVTEHIFPAQQPSTASSEGSRNELAINATAGRMGRPGMDDLEEDLIQFD